MSVKHSKEFIIDADVLIDYRDSDVEVLRMFSTQIGLLHIGRATLQKVDRLSEAAARRLKLEIETPDLDLAQRASLARGRLSYDDRETLLLAAQHDWICITNDNALRADCKDEDIGLLRGLEPMKLLVENNSLSVRMALRIAKEIKTTNPGFITDDILYRFEEQLRAMAK